MITKINFNQIKGAVVNVIDKGADPTGTTDSYAAIMAAIAAVGEMGIVYFPAGIYLTSNTITITDTDAYPGPRVAGDDHFITLKGDGREATWLLHTGNQNTGCVKITGNVFYSAGGPEYNLTENGQSSVQDMALGSTAGPALFCQFANKMNHRNLLLFSAAASGANPYSLLINSCIESYFDNVFTDAGNSNIPYAVLQAIVAKMPGGAMTLPVSNIYVQPITYNDGTHGVLPVAGNGELFFSHCRSDAAATAHSVDLRGYASGTVSFSNNYVVRFTDCKFTQVTQYDGSFNPLTWVININGAETSFTQCSFEPSPGAHTGGCMRVSSQLGISRVVLNSCIGESSGMIDLGLVGVTGDTHAIDFTMRDSQFYSMRISTNASTTLGLIKRLVLQDNIFNIAGITSDGSLSNIFNDGVHNIVTLIPDYRVEGNTVVATGASCLYQTNNCSPALDSPKLRGGFVQLLSTVVPTTGFGIYYGVGAPTLSAAQGSLYLRSDGSSTSTRMYVNTDGSTGWTNGVTGA